MCVVYLRDDQNDVKTFEFSGSAKRNCQPGEKLFRPALSSVLSHCQLQQFFIIYFFLDTALPQKNYVWFSDTCSLETAGGEIGKCIACVSKSLASFLMLAVMSFIIQLPASWWALVSLEYCFEKHMFFTNILQKRLAYVYMRDSFWKT